MERWCLDQITANNANSTGGRYRLDKSRQATNETDEGVTGDEASSRAEVQVSFDEGDSEETS